MIIGIMFASHEDHQSATEALISLPSQASGKLSPYRKCSHSIYSLSSLFTVCYWTVKECDDEIRTSTFPASFSTFVGYEVSAYSSVLKQHWLQLTVLDLPVASPQKTAFAFPVQPLPSSVYITFGILLSQKNTLSAAGWTLLSTIAVQAPGSPMVKPSLSKSPWYQFLPM